MSTLHLLNAPICHTPDIRYTTTRISRETALKLAAIAASKGKLNSAIGHDGTAQIMTALLDMPIPVSRISMQYEPGDSAIALQLRTRQPEGVVLTAEQVEAIGYDLTLIETAPAPVLVIFGSAVEAAQAMCAGGPVDASTVDETLRRQTARPGDIDVIYGGMDRQEARERVQKWARETGLDGEWSGPLLDLDLHPELCWLSPPSYTGHEDLGNRVDFPSRYEVSIPHPMGTNLPDVVVLAGKPKIKGLPVNSLAAAIRQAAAQVAGPTSDGSELLSAAKTIAGYIANQRNSLATIVLTTERRGGDASYLACSLSGIRAAWAKLMAACGETHAEREKAHDTIAGHIDGYLHGVGFLLARLVKGVSPSALARLRYESRDSTIPDFARYGTLTIQRKPGAENIWIAGAGGLWEEAAALSPWLRDLAYVDAEKTLLV